MEIEKNETEKPDQTARLIDLVSPIERDKDL